MEAKSESVVANALIHEPVVTRKTGITQVFGIGQRIREQQQSEQEQCNQQSQLLNEELYVTRESLFPLVQSLSTGLLDIFSHHSNWSKDLTESTMDMLVRMVSSTDNTLAVDGQTVLKRL